MKSASARSSRASGPHSTTKRAFDIRAARSKSMRPSASPISSCGFGAKANSRGVPQRRTSTFLSSVCPGGNGRVGQIRDLKQQTLELRVHRLELGLERLDPLAHLPHARLLGGGVLAAALGLADRLRGLVAERLQFLALAEETPALGILREDRPDQLGAATVRQASLDGLGILADQLDVQHV